MARWRNGFVGVLIAAALFGAVLHASELHKFADLLGRIALAWLLVAVLLQVSTYISLAKGWQAVLQQAEARRFGLRPLLRTALCKLFADQALPTAGMGGNVLLVDQLVAMGARRGTAIAALLLTMRGFYGAYLAFALVAIFLLWVHGRATPLMVGLVTTFILVAVSIPALALWLRRRGSTPLPAIVERIRPIRQLLEVVSEAPAGLVRDNALFRRLLAFNALIFLADVMTLFACLHGLGVAAPPSTALIAFVLASIAVTLGPIPLGLGSFEVVCTSMLHLLGVGLEAALSATLLLRVLILWLPLVPGLLFTRTMISHQASKGRPQSGST